MPPTPGPVDRNDTAAPGSSPPVGRPPIRAGTVRGRLRRLLARLAAADAADGVPRDVARAQALLAALLPRRGP